MNKKLYTSPTITKVKLEIRQSVLSTCNTTTDITPQYEEIKCSAATQCQFPPLGQ